MYLNYSNKESRMFLNRFSEIISYVDNEERDLTFVYKHNFLDIEYVIKVRDFYETYFFFVFDTNNEKCVKETEGFLTKFNKKCNIDFDMLFNDMREFSLINVGTYINLNKKTKYNLLLEKLDKDFVKVGFFLEDKKMKKRCSKLTKEYNEKTCRESLYNTLLFFARELSIDTTSIDILEEPKIDFPSTFVNKETKDIKNLYYLAKKSCAKDFIIKTKDKKNDIYFDLKYNDFSNIEMNFYFEKSKKGLVTPLLSKLNNFSIKNVSWDELYNFYCDNSYSKLIVKNVFLESQVEKLLCFKKYDIICSVTDDLENIYFNIELYEKQHPLKYFIG